MYRLGNEVFRTTPNCKKWGKIVVACFRRFSTEFYIIRFHIHVVVVKWRQRNVPKRSMHRVQNGYYSLGFVHTISPTFSCQYEKIG